MTLADLWAMPLAEVEACHHVLDAIDVAHAKRRAKADRDAAKARGSRAGRT